MRSEDLFLEVNVEVTLLEISILIGHKGKSNLKVYKICSFMSLPPPNIQMLPAPLDRGTIEPVSEIS